MGHIKEPKNIDLNIESEPLTDRARQEISDFIASYKSEAADKNGELVTAKRSKIISRKATVPHGEHFVGSGLQSDNADA